MNDHLGFLAAIPAEKRIALTDGDGRAGALHLGGHAGLIVLAAAPVALALPGWPLVLPVLGVLLVFLFAPEHECTHRTPFRPAWVNEVVGHIAGLILLLPFGAFRAYHLAHHRFTGDPGRDPELATPLPTTRWGWARRIAGVDYWSAQARQLAATAAGRPLPAWVPPGAVPRLQREARLYLAAYAAALATLAISPLALWLWIVPLVLGQPALRLYLLAEHGDCPQVASMFANTRTTFTTAAVRFLAWNMPFHAEHHILPTVPFHRLPEFHRLTRARLEVTADGYAAFVAAYLARDRSRGDEG